MRIRIGVFNSDSVAIVLGAIVIDVCSDPNNTGLNVRLETFLHQSVLGNNQTNMEFQHFDKMIMLSTPENFWMIKYHPILISVIERYYLPTDIRTAVQHDSLLEFVFDRFVDLNFGSAAANIAIRPKIASHSVFLCVQE